MQLKYRLGDDFKIECKKCNGIAQIAVKGSELSMFCDNCNIVWSSSEELHNEVINKLSNEVGLSA